MVDTFTSSSIFSLLLVVAPMFLRVASFPVSTIAFRRRVASRLGRAGIWAFHQQRIDRLFSTNDSDSSSNEMENVYAQWTLEDDETLFRNKDKTSLELACLLGRGLRGVESRREKLNDVNSAVYMRLFGGKKGPPEKGKGDKLVPAREVLRRIQYDYNLEESDFSVEYIDRVEDKVMEVKMNEQNNSVKSAETKLAMAIPEHRIVAIKFRERVVWDRKGKIDLVFGSVGGKGETIASVVENYDEWKSRHDAAKEWNRRRQAEVANVVRSLIGEEKFDELKAMSLAMQETSRTIDGVPTFKAEKFVQKYVTFFREAKAQDPSSSVSELEALEVFSELCALLPDTKLRPALVRVISHSMKMLYDPSDNDSSSSSQHELPELDENELTETFVRGSGAGGQKVNKTSNRVVLVHNPTQLRVECQDTRSLQQNRKIARKRLRLKLDEVINGAQSRTSLKASKAASKKAKAKARNKARQRKKRDAKAKN